MTDLLCKLFIKDREHTEKPEIREKYGALSGFVGISVNLLLSLVKLILGILSGSVAITADALNNLSDAGSSIVSLVSFKISSKPADRDHPFGHSRIEYIASMIVSFLIVIVGVELLSTSIRILIGLDEPKETNVNVVTIILLGTSILAKLWLSVFYKKIAKKIDSVVVKAASVDSLSDCISTGAVLISSVIIYFHSDLYFIDAAMGILVSVLILIAGVKILNETKNSLLGEAPVADTVEKIHDIVRRYPEALGIHDLMVHNYGPKNLIISLHVEVDGSKDIFELHDVIDTIEKNLHDELGYPCTIHMDPIVTNDERVNELRRFISMIVETLDPTITVHDFRTVIGATHTNLIFDIVLPFESKETPDSIKEKIANAVLEKRPAHYCVITVDRG